MRLNFVIPLLIVVLLGLMGSVYVVREGQVGLVLNLGRVARTDIGPGLHFKIPLIETARVFDRRFDASAFSPERSLTSERKDVSVDFVAIVFISDVTAFFRATSGNEDNAKLRLEPIIKNSLRNEINANTLTELVSGNRSEFVERQLPAINEANTLIKAALAKLPNTCFTDVYTPMLGADGQPDASLFREDMLHMTPAGYAIWTKALAPKVKCN